jgi:lipoyl(octanoyl) transferase
MTQALSGFFLGRRPYQPALDLMHELFEARRANRVGDLVLLLEHTPVITLGRGAQSENILASREQLAKMAVDVVETGRGGDVTLHAPGQLICYPIIDLKPDRCDVRKYVQALSSVMNELIAPYGLSGGAIKELIGLWIDLEQIDCYPGEGQAQLPAKLGAIGVRISRWITSHGFALNLSTNLELFRLIVPCGIRQFGVTSVQQLTGKCPDLKATAHLALDYMNSRLGYDKAHWISLETEDFATIKSRIYEHFSTANEIPTL